MQEHQSEIKGRLRVTCPRPLGQRYLVSLLPDYQLPAGQPVYAVYPARPWLALKSSTFIAFLQERLFAE